MKNFVEGLKKLPGSRDVLGILVATLIRRQRSYPNIFFVWLNRVIFKGALLLLLLLFSFLFLL